MAEVGWFLVGFFVPLVAVILLVLLVGAVIRWRRRRHNSLWRGLRHQPRAVRYDPYVWEDPTISVETGLIVGPIRRTARVSHIGYVPDREDD